MPTRRAIVSYWETNVPDFAVGEGGFFMNQCFGCGSNLNLQRCHIKAKVNGGDDSHSNLHILCSPCHLESESIEGSIYWDWLSYKYLNDFDFGFRHLKIKAILVARFAEFHDITDPKEAMTRWLESSKTV